MIYLDNGATTLKKPKEVYRNLGEGAKILGSPGRGGHRYAMLAGEVCYQCREEASKLFNLPQPENVIFTFNATHGLNIAIFSLVQPGMRVAVTGYEHNSVIRPLKAIGADVRVVNSELFNRDEILRAFKREIDRGIDCAVITHVSNAFGFIIPVYEIGKMLQSRKIPFIVDASQSAGCLEVNFTKLGADFVAMPGHKGLYGPQGTGLLLVKNKAKPFMYGGSGSQSALVTMPDVLPDMLEAGTHNMPGIYGLLEGIKFVRKTGVNKIFEHEVMLTQMMAKGLSDMEEYVLFKSNTPGTQSGVLSFNLKGVSPERTAELFSQYGVAMRAGLHCSPLAHKSAGTFPEGTVRASVSVFTKETEIRKFLEISKKVAVDCKKIKFRS